MPLEIKAASLGELGVGGGFAKLERDELTRLPGWWAGRGAPATKELRIR